MTDHGYQLLDCGNMRKLEKIGSYRLIRPAAQAVWRPHLSALEWDKADAEFLRHKHGEGQWFVKNKALPDQWSIDLQSLKMVIKLTDFGHLGIFPEHHRSELLEQSIASFRKQNREFKLLNLFAYTGAVSLLAASAGAQVVHLDASKTSVGWARQNAEASQLAHLPIRWITEDVKKFITREVRRGSKYQAIILDPPSYGRGTKNELWKIEEDLVPLLDQLAELKADDFGFFQLSAHSPGFTPMVLQNLLAGVCDSKQGRFHAFEMAVSEQGGQRQLPSGACCIFHS